MRWAIAAVLGGQGMVVGLGLNVADPPPPTHGVVYWALHGILLASACGVGGLLGGPLLHALVAALRHRRITVEALFALSITGALVGSLVSTVTGRGAVYYEVISILLVIYALGSRISSRSRAAALAAVGDIRTDLDHARRIAEDGVEGFIAVDELRAGEHVVVLPGEVVPVDGVVVSGTGYVSESWITGEPGPAVRRAGDGILAGVHAVDARLIVSVSGTAPDRSVDGMLAVLAEARRKPSRLQERADRVMRGFVPAVVAVSLLTFLGWFLVGGIPWPRALFNAMAVLLVACPCALGLATPIAVWAGLNRLARDGLVAASGAFLDDLATVDHVVFDKTGTLTESHLHVVDWVTETTCPHERRRLLGLVATVERDLDHPVARALQARAAADGVAPIGLVESLTLVPGGGVRVRVCEDSATVEVLMGDRSLLEAEGREAFDRLCGMSSAGGVRRRIVVCLDGRVVGAFLLAESLRDDVGSLRAGLDAAAVSGEILTGDADPAWSDLAGCPVRSGLGPLEKQSRVRSLRESGRRVLYVGDGINDTPAMTEADASIAVAGGPAITRSTADAYLAGGHPTAVFGAILRARRIRRILHGNYGFALAYNVVGMALAAAGILHPVAAAVLMAASSLLVSGRAVHAAEGSDAAKRPVSRDDETTDDVRSAAPMRSPA